VATDTDDDGKKKKKKPPRGGAGEAKRRKTIATVEDALASPAANDGSGKAAAPT